MATKTKAKAKKPLDPKVTSLKVVLYDIESLKPPDYNPRKTLKAGDREYEDIKQSILSFNLLQPLVYNTRTKTIVGGSQRYTVLKDLGYSQAPVVEVALSLADEKRLNLALNKVSGRWDEDKLKDILVTFDPNNVPFTGFSIEEVQGIIGYSSPSSASRDSRQDVPAQLPRIYQVVVTCTSEAQQTKLINDLEKKGFEAKPITI